MSKQSTYPHRVLCSFSDEEFEYIKKLSDKNAIGLATTIRMMIRDYLKGDK